jgi:CheY-like chemotaxis protein
MPDKTNIENVKKLKVLYADDDAGNFRLIEKFLKKFGITDYKGFKNGQELVNEFKINPKWDVIILDIQMKKMDGIEALNEIRQIDKKIPVIALTAHAMSTDKQKYIDLGFDRYMSKPVSSNGFYQEIISAVNNS